jgi:hypothetical protein
MEVEHVVKVFLEDLFRVRVVPKEPIILSQAMNDFANLYVCAEQLVECFHSRGSDLV